MQTTLLYYSFICLRSVCLIPGIEKHGVGEKAKIVHINEHMIFNKHSMHVLLYTVLLIQAMEKICFAPNGKDRLPSNSQRSMLAETGPP